MDEERKDERQPRPPQEGVRIIGAEEAAAALEKGEAEGRRSDDAPRFGDVPPAPSGPRPVHRFPLPGDVDPTVDIPKPTVAGSVRAEPPTASPDDELPDADAPDLSLPDEGLNVGGTASPELPHWTEPPTGEVPRVLIGDDDSEEIWSGTASRGPRWRDSSDDWDDDLDMASLAGEEPKVGALDESRSDHSDMFDFDEPLPSGQVPVAAAPVDDDLDDLDIDLDDESVAAATRTRARRAPREPRPPRAPKPRREPRPARAAAAGAPPSDAPASEADLPVRILTAVAVGIVALIAFSRGTGGTAVLATVIVTACVFEVFTVLRRAGYLPAIPIALVATVSIMAGAYWKGERAIPLVMALTLITTMLWYLLGVVRARPTVNIMLTMGAFMWVAGLGSFASLILVGFPSHHGLGVLIGAVVVTVACDIGSYLAGRGFGHNALMPDISPNKTWEGALGGLTFSLLAAIVVSGIEPWNLKHALALGLVVAVVSPLGDLCESMIKRDLSIKDMGTILPGHGGVLDRFDGMLFVLPATYYLAQYLHIK